MTGFQSRVRDALNQSAPTHATVSVAERGYLHFLDPSLTGRARFMQKSGYPFPLLTPSMTAGLLSAAAAGTRTILLSGARLLAWLRPGMVVSFELIEEAIVESFVEQPSGDFLLTVATPLVSSHAAGTSMTILRFAINAFQPTLDGEAGLITAAIQVTTPFILVPGDVIVIAGTTYQLSLAEELSYSSVNNTYEFDIKVTKESGLPALGTDTDIRVIARAAYRSEVLSMPHTTDRTLVDGPVALDWISGPMVADYLPDPESQVFIEEFDAANNIITTFRPVEKNDTLLRLPIKRDQMLFWRCADGSVNWNGSFTELRAFDSGRVHVWTPCRPPLDAAPQTINTGVVPGFAPYQVNLLSRIRPGSVRVFNTLTRAEIPSTDYTVNDTLGILQFLPIWAGTGISVVYRPRVEWQIVCNPSVDNVEVTVVVGREPKQVFPLGLAGVSTIITVKSETSDEIDQLHITARRADDSPGAFIVQVGDWQPRGSITAALRYSIVTGATVDYDWASSGLLMKPLWPHLALLKARLDGSSILSRYFDNGRMLL